MKTHLAVFAGIVLVMTVGSARAEKPLKDYSFIRGVNYDMQGDQASDFNYSKTSTDKILDAAEYAANLLEPAEMVPMYVPPSAQINFWRGQPPEKRDRDAIRAFTYDLGLTLKKYCLLY